MAKILIVEDSAEVLKMLSLSLKNTDSEIYTAKDGMEGLREFHRIHPDLVVIDVRLPKMNGVTLCQRIRELSDVPILMTSAEAIMEEDIVTGLEAGADEYVRKPLGTVEFPARVRAMLRRNRGNSEESNSDYGDEYLQVDLKNRYVWVGGKEERLTPTEFKLLSTFLRNKGQVLTFQQLLERVWGFEYNSENHYPRIYVSHLRRKIEPDPKNPTYIQSEYGIGYRFVGK